MHRLLHVRALSLLLTPVLLVGACEALGVEEGEDEDGELVAQVAADECVSGLRWVGGNEESTLMRPGGDCIGCHQQSGEGPRYLVAGTVHELLGEPSDCFGLEGVTVEITDANERSWSLPTNEAGNFYLPESQGPLAMPYRAAVVMDGARMEMATAQSDGRCASCHTASGEMGAAGRIVVP